MEQLVEKEYFDISKGLPPRGAKQVFELHYKNTYENDRKGLGAPPGEDTRKGEPCNGGGLVMFLHSREMAITLCTGQGGESAKQMAAHA